MFKWTNHVKPRQFLPQPHSFSIKTPSFQASWSNPLSPVVWDTFRPGAPPLKNLLLLHQGVVFYSWFLGARRIGSWVGVSPLSSFKTCAEGSCCGILLAGEWASTITWIPMWNIMAFQDKHNKTEVFVCSCVPEP